MKGMEPIDPPGAVAAADCAGGAFDARWQKVKRWSWTLAEFALVQCLVQLLNAVAGLLIVRVLPKPEYALYAVANAMQATYSQLAYAGTGIGMRSIGGKVWNNPLRMGELLRTVVSLRYRFALLAGLVCVPITAWMLWRGGASLSTNLLLSSTVLAGFIPLLSLTAWLGMAQLHGEYRRIQKLELSTALFRLATVGTMALTFINAFTALLAGAVGSWIQKRALEGWGRFKVNVSANISPEDHRELMRLSLRSLPNTVFFCFQGQITLLILTWFGNPTGIADLTALGRLALLLAVFSSTFSNVVGPRFARCQDPARLPRLYLAISTGAAILFVGLTMAAAVFPQPLLLLLGSQYSGLRQELIWVIATAGISQVGGVLWNLNISKAWIAFQSVLYIPMSISAIVASAFLFDLHSFIGILRMNLLLASAPIPIFLLDGCKGLMANKG